MRYGKLVVFSFFLESQNSNNWSRTNEPRHEKTNVLVSDLVQHKPGCTATEDGYGLEISDLGSKGIVLSV